MSRSLGMPRGRALVAAVSSCALMLTGCTSLPGDGSPQALRSYAPPKPSEEDLAPVKDREPDLLLRDFFAACGKPNQQHQAARGFLTPTSASQWNDQESTTIVDRIDLNSKPGTTPTKVEYVVRGNVVGTLGTGGAYSPVYREIEETISLVKQPDGQWRIDQLPQGVLLERTEFRNNFEPEDLFFFDSTNRFLVRDRRWVYKGQPSEDTALLSLLVEGPKGLLAPGVETAVPVGATFAGYTDGAYNFAGFTELSAEQRHRFAAQVVWTLAKAGVAGPYRVLVDGTDIEPGQGELDVDDVAEFNPSASTSAISPLYALSNGSLLQVEDNRFLAVNNPLGSSGRLTSADVSTSGDFNAAVLSSGNPAAPDTPVENESASLLAGPLDGPVTKVLDARRLTRPSFEYGASAIWTVIDDHKVARIARSATTGEFSQQVVDTPFLADDRVMSELRLSPTGVRAAMIIDGEVFVGTVVRSNPGERRIENVVSVAPVIGGSALTLDWMHDGALIVGTDLDDSPVWRVEPDGSGATPLPSGNLTAPVTSVATSATTMYVRDARAVLQLPTNTTSTSSSSFWREVPALLGTKAQPIVPN